ncbi:MAG: translocation/assembly module TamB domain-containing protein, partial [Acidobacteriaceae bacterium]
MNATPQPHSAPPPDAGPRPGRAGRIALRIILWTLAVMVVLTGALSWYANTSSFRNRVRRAVIARLEKSTGGRVELRRFSWRLTHLEFEADDLTIHGLEGPDQAPYAHVDRLYVRLQVLSFFRPKIGLNYLEADHPEFHLIVYPDGTTNQPKPKHPSTGSTTDEIFDLQIGRTLLDNGVAILNDRAIPFNLSANNLAAQVSYVPARDHYVGTLHAEDIEAQRGATTPLHSALDASLDMGRDTAQLVSLTLRSGPRGKTQKTVVRIAGALNNFAHPSWQFTMKGAVDALEVRALTGMPGLDAGTAQVDLSGHGASPSAAGASLQFAIDGTARISGLGYHTGSVHVTNLTAAAAAHVTQDAIAVTGIRAHLATGGTLNGDMRIVNWESPSPGRSTAAERGAIRASLAGFTADSLLDVAAPRRFRRMGFDTSVAGAANITWTGAVTNLVGAVNLSLMPPHPPHPNEVPVEGFLDATYFNRSGSVAIRTLDIHTPASRIEITGNLGVYPMTRKSELQASLVTTNLSEFNPALAAFGIEAHGRPSPVPAQLNGQAQFHGTVTGSLRDPDFSGHLEATNFTIVPPASMPAAAQLVSQLHFDTITADAAYSAGSLSIRAATLVQGKTTIQVSGDVRGREDAPAELFADSSAVRAQVEVKNADLQPWLALTGKSYPVSGTLNLEARTGGTIGDLNATGQLTLTGGSIDGEPYRSLTTNLAVQGREVSASHLVFAVDGGHITGNGGYNLTTQRANFDLQGSGFELAHIRRLQNEQYPILGTVAFSARGDGTFDDPSLQASVHLTNLRVARESTGSVDIEAHTVGRALQTQVSAHLNNSTISLNSQTQLGDDYPTRATLNIAKFDIDPILRTFSVTGIRGSSSIAASLAISGPLKRPKELSGTASVSEFALTLEDVPIHSDGPLHASLRNGTLQVDEFHIVGQDTDLRTHGSIGLFEKPRPIQGTASGSINMALVQTLDTDILSSGHVDFTMNAAGTVDNPDLTGNVKFTNVNVALEDYVNGLSRMNGELVFDQNRLDFRNVTAYSGGGLIRVGGFVTYHHGLYADLTATANDVHIRYPEGVTSTANATIRFQGSQASMLLSGKVLLTGFSVSPSVDFAAVAASTGGISLPPNPNAPSNRVRLDIRISSSPSLNFQNSFARLAGNVDLAIRGTLAQPTVLGRVTITEGRATFNGDKFELQHGEIYFTNPVRIQPTLDIIATTTVEDYTIT